MSGLILKILKYELKNYKNYIMSDKRRKTGFFVSIAIILFYSYFIVMLLLSLGKYISNLHELLLESLSSIMVFLSIIGLAGGFSITSAMSRIQKNRINLILMAPLDSAVAIRVFVLVDSLSVVLFYILMLYPLIITILVIVGMGLLEIVGFIITTLMTIVVFTSVGVSLGVLYTKLKTRHKVIIGVTLAIIGGVLYSLFFFGSEYSSEIMNLLFQLVIAINNDLSPFNWAVAPALIRYDRYWALKTIAIMIFDASIFMVVTKYLHNQYMTGRIRAPKEAVAIKRRKYPILRKLYGVQVSSIISKDLKALSRDPALISSLAFAFVIYIVLFIDFSSVISSGNEFLLPFTLGFLSGIIIVAIPMSLSSTAMGLEQRNIGLLLSSPIPPYKIIKAKMALSEITIFIMIAIMIATVYYIQIYLLVALILYILSEAFVLLGISAIVAAKYIDFKAENPRKALTTTGGIILIIPMLAMMFLSVFVLMVILANLNIITIAVEGIFTILAYLMNKYLYRLAGKQLSKRDGTEFL